MLTRSLVSSNTFPLTRLGVTTGGGPDLYVNDQPADFGSLTLASAGGFKPYDTNGNAVSLLSVDDQTGATRTWSINGSGALVANGTPGVDDGIAITCSHASGSVVLTISTEANKYSAASAAEVAAAWADAAASTATGIKVREVDDTASTNISLASKAFTNNFRIEPHQAFTKAAFPVLNTYTAALPGLRLGNATENVTIYGLSFYDTLDDLGLESNGVLEVTSGGTANRITFEACKVRSRDFLDAFDNGIFADSVGFSAYASVALFFTDLNATRGIVAEDCDGLEIIDNDIRYVTRGIYHRGCGAFGGSNSKITGNDIQSVVSNFTTHASGSGSDGVEIHGNRGLHVWGSDGEVPSNPLHSATGLSFDGGSSFFNNVSVKGNQFHAGWERKKYTIDSGQSYTVTSAATGMKANDPTETYTYRNFTVAHNLIVSHGICMEFSGAQGVDIYNNTLAPEDYVSPSQSIPSYYFQGCENLRMWNNIGPSFTLGINDGGTENGQSMVTTTDTSLQYGNWSAGNYNGDLAFDQIFTGNAGDFSFPELSDLESYYTPVPSTFPLTAAEKKGALGTGYWDGTTDTAPSFSAPSTAETPSSPSTTVWDGLTYATRGAGLTGASDGRYVTIAWQGELHADMDGAAFYFCDNSSSRIALRHLADNTLRLYIEDPSNNLIMQADSGVEITSANGQIALAVSVDLVNGRALMALNGTTAAMPMDVADSVSLADIDWTVANFSLNGSIFGTQIFKGNFDVFYQDDTFIDLDTSAGLASLFASDGLLKDLSATSPLVLIQGKNAAAINAGVNDGTGGTYSLTGGTVTDLAAGFAVDEGSSTATFSTSGGSRIATLTNGQTLVVTTAGTPTGIEFIGGGAGGGGRSGGGGGAGELIQDNSTPPTFTAQTYTATVGAGGTGGDSGGIDATGGGNTELVGGTTDDIALLALGGGAGGTLAGTVNGAAGGSGGGASSSTAATGGASTASDGVGFAGGNETTGTGGAGGGGAGSAGADNDTGTGGSGVASIVPGDSTTYCVGGDGGPASGTNGAAGTNYGDGGQGGSGTFGSRLGGDGASGIIRVWWPV